MKKFKSILALTASVLALSAFAAPVSAFATEINQNTGDPKTGAYDLEYTAGETYTVTIPATAVQFDATGAALSSQNQISVSDVRLNATHSAVKVTIDSLNKIDNNTFAMALLTDNTPTYDPNTKLAYTAKVNGAENNLSVGSTVIQVENGTGDTLGSGDASLDFTITGTALKAGTYRDTLTFTVSLVNA